MNLALVDDSPYDMEKIRRILSDYAAYRHASLSVSAFDSAEKLLADYRPLLYTAVFLDIYMKGMSGIDAARRIRETDRDALIVFLSASEDHMPAAWRVHAFEYVLKPVSRESLFPVLDDILSRVTPARTPGFSFTSQKASFTIFYDDLVMVSTDAHNYLEVTDRSGQSRTTLMTFAEAGNLLLRDKRFLQIRRGVIVNMAFIRQFDDAFCYLTASVAPVPISSRSRKKLEQVWDNYLLDTMRADAVRGRGYSLSVYADLEETGGAL